MQPFRFILFLGLVSVTAGSALAITVTSPNGGEQLCVGSTHHITWSPHNIFTTVRLLYSTDNGSSWTFIDSSTTNDGSYAWTVPNTPSPTCVVQVARISFPIDSDISDSTFCICAPNIDIQRPSSGEVLCKPQSKLAFYNITWNSICTSGTVDIKYYKGLPSIPGLEKTIVLGTEDDGSFAWQLPASLSTGFYTLIISDGETEDRVLFEINLPYIDINKPQDGEKFCAGVVTEIVWKSGCIGETVDITYQRVLPWPPGTVQNIALATDNDGSYFWPIPSSLNQGIYKLSVSDNDNSDNINFQIKPQLLEIQTPNEGDKLCSNQVIGITWNSDCTGDSVALFYQMGETVEWSTLVTHTVNDGRFDWTPPPFRADQMECRVKVADLDGDPYAVSGRFVIQKPQITVNNPDGQVLVIGNPQGITWESRCTSGQVSIDYSVDGGVNWKPITGGTEDDGYYQWTVPDDPCDNAHIRISDVDADPVGQTVSGFRIVDAYIKVNVPGGVEKWGAGTKEEIMWASENTSGLVRLEYSIDGGNTWNLIEENVVDEQIITNRYLWLVPEELSDQCQIRITDMDGYPSGISDGFFEITDEFIWLGSPVHHDTWAIDSDHDIIWMSGNGSGEVNLYYKTSMEGEYKTIVESCPDTGAYKWRVPNDPAKLDAWMKITDASKPLQDINGPFTIECGPTHISQPTSREVIKANTEYTIKWQSFCKRNRVQIDYSLNDGVDWHLIVTDEPDLGEYTWTVPDTFSANARIKVTAYINGPCAISDAFIIDRSTLEITYPNGGELLPVGSRTTITWNSSGGDNTATLQYTTRADSALFLWQTIDQVTVGDGSYDWVVPNSVSNNCKVRIIAAKTGVQDESDESFSICQPMLNFVSPLAGEELVSATLYSLIWESHCISDHVTLEYWTRSISEWSLIASHVEDNDGGVFDWLVPQQPEKVKLRILDEEGLAGDTVTVYIKPPICEPPALRIDDMAGYYQTEESFVVPVILDSNDVMISEYEFIFHFQQPGLRFIGISEGEFSGFTFETTVLTDSSVRIHGVSTTNSIPIHSTGVLLGIELEIDPSTCPPGSYRYIYLRDLDMDITGFNRCDGRFQHLNCKFGDVNQDGQITIEDYDCLLEILSNGKEADCYNDCVPYSADIDGNGTITAADALALNDFIREHPGKDLTSPVDIVDPEHDFTLTLPSINTNPGEQVSIGVNIDNPSSLQCFSLEIVFPSDLLQLVTVNPGELTQDWSFFNGHLVSENRLFVTAMCSEPAEVTEESVLVNCIFTAEQSTGSGDLMLENLLDQIVGATVQNGVVYIYPTGVETGSLPVKHTDLLQNYPNPFNASTEIVFTLHKPGYCRLCIYDMLGKRVVTLVDAELNAGRYRQSWSGRNLQGDTVPSGIYFAELVTNGLRKVKKMILLK